MTVAHRPPSHTKANQKFIAAKKKMQQQREANARKLALLKSCEQGRWFSPFGFHFTDHACHRDLHG